MKTVFLIIISVALFTSTMWTPQVYALCAEVNYDAKLTNSELVFAGTVTRLDNYGGSQKVTFFIHDILKGEVDTPKYVFQNIGKTFHENGSVTSSSLDVDYKIGKTYKVYVEKGRTDGCTTKLTDPPTGYIWEPGPEDGNYYSDEYEKPLQEYQDANERKSYIDALDDGSITLPTEPPNLTDTELDTAMNSLYSHGLDHTELPIASIAIDYKRDILVLWTPDLTLGNKVQELIGDVPFVLLYEEAPPRWTHGDPEPEPKGIIDDVCGPTVLSNSEICNRSLSPYPAFIIVAFLLVVGLFVYWFTLGKRK